MKKFILFLTSVLLTGLSLHAQETWTDENGTTWRFTTYRSNYDYTTGTYTNITATLYGSSSTEYGVTTYTPCVSGTIPDVLVIPSVVFVDGQEYTVTGMGSDALRGQPTSGTG